MRNCLLQAENRLHRNTGNQATDGRHRIKRVETPRVRKSTLEPMTPGYVWVATDDGNSAGLQHPKREPDKMLNVVDKIEKIGLRQYGLSGQPYVAACRLAGMVDVAGECRIHDFLMLLVDVTARLGPQP